jgi:hypothetical protein
VACSTPCSTDHAYFVSVFFLDDLLISSHSLVMLHPASSSFSLSHTLHIQELL